MKSLDKIVAIALFIGASSVMADNAPGKASADLQARADQMKVGIDEVNRHVLHLQALARKDKDVIKLTCINDKLVQIKAQMDIADTARAQLDGDSAMAAFEVLEKASNDVKRLRSEADVCAGELEMYKQESKSDFEGPTLDDPTLGQPFQTPEQVGTPDVDQPGFATPYK